MSERKFSGKATIRITTADGSEYECTNARRDMRSAGVFAALCNDAVEVMTIHEVFDDWWEMTATIRKPRIDLSRVDIFGADCEVNTIVDDLEQSGGCEAHEVNGAPVGYMYQP